jgi:hypothetical protein
VETATAFDESAKHRLRHDELECEDVEELALDTADVHGQERLRAYRSVHVPKRAVLCVFGRAHERAE